MTVSALVFDFDGLLMDTESTMLASWRYEWQQHQLELALTGFFPDHGGDLTEDRYTQLATAVGPSYDRDASRARRTAYRDNLNASLDLAPGIRAWLDEASSLGLRLAIASSSPVSWVTRMLTNVGFLDRFELLACGDEVPTAKPDPAVYLLALQRLGLGPDQAIAFEDSPHGVAAAKSAGLRCVAIPNSHTDSSRFTTADLVLSSAAARPLADVIATAT